MFLIFLADFVYLQFELLLFRIYVKQNQVFDRLPCFLGSVLFSLAFLIIYTRYETGRLSDLKFQSKPVNCNIYQIIIPGCSETLREFAQTANQP